MVDYVEDPFGRIVNVHWKDDDGPPPDFYWPCGGFRHGYGLGTTFPNLPGASVFILTDFNIYAVAFDHTADRDADKPNSYWWSTADYVPRGSVIHPEEVPYVWGPVPSWTVTVDLVELLARYPTARDVYIEEYRNRNIQSDFFGTGTADRLVPGAVINILNRTGAEVYPPGFRVRCTTDDFGPGRIVSYPPTLIQAHCEHETIGAYPPLPAGHRPGNFWYQYPAPGSDLWPLKPPPPPPF